MQKTKKGQLCLQKVTIAQFRRFSAIGWAVSTDSELATTNNTTSVQTVPTGQTQNTSSDVPTCRFHTLK
jgi:hypothetical protein